MGSCNSKSRKQMDRSELVDRRIEWLPRRVKPAILPIWRDEDILGQIVIPRCPVVVFFSGSSFNSVEIERSIRYYQDKFVFAAYRCFEDSPSSLSLTAGIIPCVVLYAEWLDRKDQRRVVQVGRDQKTNVKLIDSLFQLFENHEFPDWWTVVTNDHPTKPSQLIPPENYCLHVRTLQPLSFVSQCVCEKLQGSFNGRLHVLVQQTQELISDDDYSPTKTVCRFLNRGEEIAMFDTSNIKFDLHAFVDQISLWMNSKQLEQLMDSPLKTLSKMKTSVGIRELDNGEIIMESGMYVSNGEVGAFDCKIGNGDEK